MKGGLMVNNWWFLLLFFIIIIIIIIIIYFTDLKEKRKVKLYFYAQLTNFGFSSVEICRLGVLREKRTEKNIGKLVLPRDQQAR